MSTEHLQTEEAIEQATGRKLTTKEANKVALGALIGTALEWYDFFLFSAAAALIFNVQYFVTENEVAAAMASFATFGVGLVARPLGGIIFGHLGDRIGRRKVLMMTIVGIGVITGLIGALPTYAAIGIAAPILLVLLRVLQGLFVGGEWSGAMTIVVENAPLERRAIYAAIPQIGSPLGTIFSSGGFFLISVWLTKETFDAWGWRIPFLAAIPLLLLAIYIRSKLEESPVFQEMLEAGETAQSPVKETFQKSWKQILVGMAAALLGIGGFYLVTAFAVWYGTKILGYSDELMLLSTIIAAAVEIPVLVFGGRIGAKFGSSRVVIWGGVVSALCAFPSFILISSGVEILVILGVVIPVCALSLPYAASGTVLTGLFPATTRYTGVGIASNSAGMLAGFVPLIATGSVAAVNNHWWPAAMLLVVLSLLTAVSGLLAPRISVNLPGFKH